MYASGRGIALALAPAVRTSAGTVRNVAGLLLGFGFGMVLMSPTVSALSMVPGLSLLAPSNNSNVSGTITFVAAADSEGLVSLQFKVDGNDYGSVITGGSCRATFDTRQTGDGPHTVTALGVDEFGNSVLTQPSTIFVNNVAPAISNVAVANITSSSATIFWSTAAMADGRVDYGVTMSYGGTAYEANMGTAHAVALTGLTSGTTYHFAAMSFGQNGILSQSGDFVFTTAGAPGTPTPTPTPTPIVPGPTPTPSPTPVFPSPTPAPTPTPVFPSPTPGPAPSPSPTPTYASGRTAPGGSGNLGSAIPRTDGPLASPTPGGTVTGQATVRGATVSNIVPNSGVVSRSSGQSVTNATVFTGGTSGSGSGQHMTVSMLMGAYSTGGSTTTSTQPATTNLKPRGAQSNTDSKSSDYTPCAGPNPFLKEGGICVNGTWIKPDPQTQDAGTGGTTSDSSSTSTGGATGTTSTTGGATTGATGGGSTSSDSTTSPVSSPAAPGTSSTTGGLKPAGYVLPVPKSASACSTPDPYAAKGGVGICVKGEWVLLFKPGKGK